MSTQSPTAGMVDAPLVHARPPVSEFSDTLDWFTRIQYRLLKHIAPAERNAGSRPDQQSKLTQLLGEDFVRRLAGTTVLDFGCGEGLDAVEMACLGARRVIGLDIREDVLRVARARAARHNARAICHFTMSWTEPVDRIISIDAFEHFENPGSVLELMAGLLRPRGEVLVSFGPTWYHPLGGHLFSIFPWAHLIFTERALIRWRSDIRSDGATRFSEVAGGLNQMTIARFISLVERSPLRLETLELVPIRKLRPLHNRLTREFTTAVVRCRMVLR